MSLFTHGHSTLTHGTLMVQTRPCTVRFSQHLHSNRICIFVHPIDVPRVHQKMVQNFIQPFHFNENSKIYMYLHSKWVL